LFPQNWTIYRGTLDGAIKVDANDGKPPPSLVLTQSRTNNPDPPPFGSDTNSVYWSNPNTGTLSDFELDFWIKFETDVSKAFITFRMQDDQNYFAAMLSDTSDWYSEFYRFVGGVGTSIGSRSIEQEGAFKQDIWSHVRLVVKGQLFLAFKDGSPLFNATDSQFAAGKKLGIGVYNGYTFGTFKVDSFQIETTEELVYTQVLTSVTMVTVVSTQIIPITATDIARTTIVVPVTVTDTTRTTSTEVDTFTTTSNLSVYGVSSIVQTTTYTTTRIMTQTQLDIQVYGITTFVYAVVGFLAAIMTKEREKDRHALAIGSIIATVVVTSAALFLNKLELGIFDSVVVIVSIIFGFACGAIIGLRRSGALGGGTSET
jgi:hypothetical protein